MIIGCCFSTIKLNKFTIKFINVYFPFSSIFFSYIYYLIYIAPCFRIKKVESIFFHLTYRFDISTIYSLLKIYRCCFNGY